jgi:hypothetical protein
MARVVNTAAVIRRGRHEGQFGHLFLHMVTDAKEALGSLL